MSQPPLALKRPTGFFAAGREVGEALALLSDGAFKLFVHVCLHAERATGRLRFRQADLAHRLSKSPRSIGSYLEELQRKSVCEVHAAANQHRTGLIEVSDRFWPYRKPAADTPAQHSGCYVERVRELFRSRPCVAGSFTAADERLAEEWQRRGVPLEQLERAYLLGCARKYVALLNHPGAPLISSLRYFETLLGEVSEQHISAGYWQHLARQVQQLERRWRQSVAVQPAAHANFAQAGTASTAQNKGETR
jgi:hypothetical protein